MGVSGVLPGDAENVLHEGGVWGGTLTGCPETSRLGVKEALASPGGEAGEGGQGLGWGSRATRPHLETSDRGLIGPLQQRVLGAWRPSPGLPHPVKRPSPFSLISGLGARWAMPGRGREGSQVCGRASAHQGSAAPGRPRPSARPQQDPAQRPCLAFSAFRRVRPCRGPRVPGENPDAQALPWREAWEAWG